MTTFPAQPPANPAGRSRFWRVQGLYLAVSCVLLGLVLWLPKNRTWLTQTVGRFYEQRHHLGSRTDVTSRRRAGYGDVQVYTDLIRQRCQPDDYFLIPPQQYLIRNAYRQGAATGYAWLYPSVLYYHLGRAVHLIGINAPDSLLQRATHTFWVVDGKLFLLTFKPHNRPLVMNTFKQYDPHFFAYTPAQAKAYYQSKP